MLTSMIFCPLGVFFLPCGGKLGHASNGNDCTASRFCIVEGKSINYRKDLNLKHQSAIHGYECM